ncbi:alpha/beta fold hydrolase [Amnibacterium kyonggiense]|uniref:Pimeloyl-ACP methyl ester carboxylesterase n=1 Tax=Amnibacterium kyonggiense TaxID=595671 RepID=A0A4R7FEU6_9MICO|nr:alpha/beta hydrolase [Amnibacterium kyonggiense]TDS74465.1 pimeloyl-ACP methyl ester carboxylesterase [Amnibacterium kyonggiense]
MPTMDIGTGTLWYEEFGSGDEVVLSSAMGFARGGYPEVLGDPPTGYRVFTIQARGFGRSTHPAAPPEIGWLDQWADDVCAFADRIGVDRFLYTGISHGGGIGWHIARRNPARLKALISVVGTPHDRAGGTGSSEGRRRFIAQRKDPAAVVANLEHMAGWTDDPARIESRRVRFAKQAEEAGLRPDDEAELNQGKPFPEATTDEELAEVYRGIRLPVLILAGMRDGVISPQSALRAAVNVRGAKAVLFEDEGHMVGEESAERLVREVRVFVDELNGVAEPPMRA